MQEDVSLARANKIGFPLVNFAFLASWLTLCFHLAQHWRSMDGQLRADMEYLTAIFLILWVNLLIERTKPLCLGLVCASFWGVLALAFRFI
jgi:hypothetical protein